MARQIILIDIGSSLSLRGVLPSVAQFGSYSARVHASDGQPPYTYTVTIGRAAMEAAGIYLDAGTGLFSAGSVSIAGSLPITVRSTDITGAYVERQYVIVVIAEPLLLSGHAPNGEVGVEQSYTYTASGGVPPRTYSLVAAPAGWSIPDPSAPTVVMTAASGGANSWTVRAEDSASGAFDLADSATFAYADATISGTFAAATVGTPYSSDLPLSGGDGTWSNAHATVGTVPTWGTLSIVGSPGAYKLRLAGTPTGSATTVDITVAVDSGDGQTATSAQSFAVTIAFVPVAFDPAYCNTAITLSDANYSAAKAAAGYNSVYGAVGKSSGKWQIEALIAAIGGTIAFGVADKTTGGTGNARGVLSSYVGDVNSGGVYSCGVVTFSGSAYLFRNIPGPGNLINSQAAGSLTTGNYLSACVDLDAGTIALYKNGVFITGTNVALSASIWFPAASFANGGKLTLTNGSLVHPIAGYAAWG